VHHVSIVLARKNIAGATHIGGKLVHNVNAADNVFDDLGFAEVPKNKFISVGRSMLMLLDIHTSNPIPLALQALYKVTPNKSPGTADKYSIHFLL